MPYQLTTSQSVPSAASRSAQEARRQAADDDINKLDRKLKDLDAREASLQAELARARSDLEDTQAQSLIARREVGNADSRPSQGTYNSIHVPKRVSRFTAANMAWSLLTRSRAMLLEAASQPLEAASYPEPRVRPVRAAGAMEVREDLEGHNVQCPTAVSVCVLSQLLLLFR
jgi:hypothetical protein